MGKPLRKTLGYEIEHDLTLVTAEQALAKNVLNSLRDASFLSLVLRSATEETSPSESLEICFRGRVTEVNIVNSSDLNPVSSSCQLTTVFHVQSTSNLKPLQLDSSRNFYLVQQRPKYALHPVTVELVSSDHVKLLFNLGPSTSSPSLHKALSALSCCRIYSGKKPANVLSGL